MIRKQQTTKTGKFEFWTSWVSKRTIEKKNRSLEEIHDLRIMIEFGYECLQKQERAEIGPAHSQVEKYQVK